MKTRKDSLVTASSTVVTCMTIFATLLCLRAPADQFTNVTASAGITNAPGYCISAAWGDYNNDQFIDLYLAIGTDTSATNALFRNNGNGTFTRVGAEGGPIATDRHDALGCAWIDFNNDGFRDMFVVNGGWSPARNDLYWNNGDGTFRSGDAGNLTQLSQGRGWSACADYDGDGWVDVYVGEGSSVSGPFANRLYRATGTGTFVSTNLGPTLAYVNSGCWGDYDNDGDPDLFICAYTSPSTLWRNDGRGNFTAANNGLPANAQTVHAAWGDYDRDGDLDIALCNHGGANPRETSLYRNDGASGFAFVTTVGNVGSWPAWADYDNDGHLDLLVTDGQNTARKAALYHNNGDGTFGSAVEVFTETADYWLACPWGDFDNDGFMDVILTHRYSQHRLFRNLTNANHWIKFKLVGAASNRDAIGAKVRVQASIGGESVWQMQEVNGGYALQNDTRLNFGLGDATNVDLVRIEWPSGNVQELVNLTPNQIRTVTEVVNITPTRPTASLNGAVSLTRTLLAGATYQWRFDGVDLEGQTNRVLNLTNITADIAGRYSVVVSNATTLTTNFVYLFVDPQFTKITTGAPATDRGCSWGASWGDYDSDGFADLFVARTLVGKCAVYHNNGDGTFTTVSNVPASMPSGEWSSSAWADLDNDGLPDLIASRHSTTASVYFNNGNGIFSNPLQLPVGEPWSVAVSDFNHDGLLDILFSCGSTAWGAQVSVLYRNSGNRTFVRMNSQQVGPIVSVPTFGAATWADYDDDGWGDLYCPNWAGLDRIFHNERTGQFTSASNLVTQGSGFTAGAWGDYDSDGRIDLCASSWGEPSLVYRNIGNGEFQRATNGLTTSGKFQSVSWADYDNDGFLDLLLAGQGNQLWHNNGDGTLTPITTGSIATESPVDGSFWSYSALWFDYNNDGFLDLYVSNGNDPRTVNVANFFYHNNGNTNGWLKVKLVGTTSNRDAVGAKVRAYAYYASAYRWQRRDVSGGDGYNGNHLYAHFGLGNATVVNKLRIEWPSGVVEELSSVTPRQTLTFVEPSLRGSFGPDAKFHLLMTMSTNRVYHLEVSPDLVNWTVVTNCTGSGSCTPIEYVDPESPAVAGVRFYRMR